MKNHEECHICGGNARSVCDPFEVQIGHRSTMVDAERWRCDSCGGEFFAPGQMEIAQRQGADNIRSERGLLTPEAIKDVREGFRLSQAAFESLLGVGPKTVVRWERGTVFQNSATDALLRVLRDVPGVAEYLSAARRVALPMAASAENSPPTSSAPKMSFQFYFHSPDLPSKPMDDPKVVSLENYRSKKALEPIPPELVRARL